MRATFLTVTPAKAGPQSRGRSALWHWIPAFAGMTIRG